MHALIDLIIGCATFLDFFEFLFFKYVHSLLAVGAAVCLFYSWYFDVGLCFSSMSSVFCCLNIHVDVSSLHDHDLNFNE